MIKLCPKPVKLKNGSILPAQESELAAGREKTMAYGILRNHDAGSGGSQLRIRFDSLISHDITYVGIIQTARASGLERFPVPYVLTNCHNSLCAVGGTINEDDHIFGLSAAKKYGGIYVPANQAVIHQYARERLAGCGRMVLGSDSHTRYGALGTMGVGEGGPELVKQLLENTYDIKAPEVVLVYMTGRPQRGVGPHDVAIELCGAVYKNGFVKNKVLEFAGPGVSSLPMDYRIGIDVMTTETACLSSVWVTDERVEAYLAAHGRRDEYRAMSPADGAAYDSMIEIDLSAVEPMAALPFHPSEAYTIRELKENAEDILHSVEKRVSEQFGGKVSMNLAGKLKNGSIMLDQGIIAGCAGGMYDNIAEAAAILDGCDVGNGYFSLSVYPPSVPVNLRLMRSGVQARLMESGALFKSCFCGPCFGAGDVPGNNTLSARHTTRNFPNREGSRPGDGQIAGVLLMDARSIAATARNRGLLTAATDIDYVQPEEQPYEFDGTAYEKRVYNGFGNPQSEAELRFGPNIADWPAIPALGENLVMQLAAVIQDEVTTTDELIPSGETSSYRSNPMKLASFALSRRVPEYVPRTEKSRALEAQRASGDYSGLEALLAGGVGKDELERSTVGSVIFARRPGDGSAREQAASCQRVLGGCANICYDYATKRYRSNCINWGMLPFTIAQDTQFDYEPGDIIYVPGVRRGVINGAHEFSARVFRKNGAAESLTLRLGDLTDDERDIILRGCLMNHYAAQHAK